ncbi:hypothetical protein T492DRAFT_908308 [Pavlovales sp. CCMP2436]|nr:hypothetical protein T492DRAFT_908308 [Pavlovales sp. CCMP2436]
MRVIMPADAIVISSKAINIPSEVQLNAPAKPARTVSTKLAAVAVLALVGVCTLVAFAAGGASQPKAAFAVDGNIGRRLDMAIDVHSARANLVFPNEYCIGKEGKGGANPRKDGNGFICKAAVGKTNCTSASELAGLQCACCNCYVQCGMKNTYNAMCKDDAALCLGYD